MAVPTAGPMVVPAAVKDLRMVARPQVALTAVRMAVPVKARRMVARLLVALTAARTAGLMAVPVKGLRMVARRPVVLMVARTVAPMVVPAAVKGRRTVGRHLVGLMAVRTVEPVVRVPRMVAPTRTRPTAVLTVERAEALGVGEYGAGSRAAAG
jgi:hypothetical protein